LFHTDCGDALTNAETIASHVVSVLKDAPERKTHSVEFHNDMMMDCRVTVMDCSETANCTNSSVGVTVSAVFSNGYY